MERSPDIDDRSSLFYGLNRESLAELSGTWPTSPSTPGPVTEVLADARRLFVGAAVSYDNFVASALKALQAADLALKLLLGFDVLDRRTLGWLVEYESRNQVLDADTRLWFREFALHFRNELSHPHRSVAMTPGMAEPIVRSVHERVVHMFPSPSVV